MQEYIYFLYFLQVMLQFVQLDISLILFFCPKIFFPAAVQIFKSFNK